MLKTMRVGNGNINSMKERSKIKEVGAKIYLLLNGKSFVYDNVDLLYSGENFIRFTDGKNTYRYSGHYMIVTKSKKIKTDLTNDSIKHGLESDSNCENLNAEEINLDEAENWPSQNEQDPENSENQNSDNGIKEKVNAI